MRLKFKSLTRECLLRPHQLADIMESKRDTGTRRHLLTFPLELYLKLFSDLEPLELLQLSQTCKQLHETLSDKQIWKTALRKMCSQEHLFEPSFPIEEMEVGDMQRAALGPTLWKNKVHRHAKLGPNHPLPYVERSFGGDYEPGLRREVIFTDTHIVPGGRYLLSSSTKFITLWDLGPPLTALRQTPRVVDTLSLEGTGWYVRRLDPPIIQTSSLRFGAQVSDWLSTDITYKVFEIGPLPEDVCIREIWKPQIAGVSYAFIQVNNWFYLVDWSFVAVMKNNFISLCDISHENIFSAALVIPCPEDLGQTKVPTSIAMVNGYLVALTNDNDVVLWIVSELQSSLQDESGFYFKPPREPPSFIFPLLSHRGRFEGERQCSPARWYLDSASAYIIDFVVSNSSGVDSTDEGSDGHRWSTSIEITRCTVDLSASQHFGAITDKVHCHDEYLLRTRYTIEPQKESFYSSGRLFHLFLPYFPRYSMAPSWKRPEPQETPFSAVVSCPPASDDGSSEWLLAYFTTPTHWKDRFCHSWVSLDPQTGRLAYACEDVSQETRINEIHLLDFQLLSD